MPQEYVVRWSGPRTPAGASVLHFQSIGSGSAAQTIANDVRAFYQSLIGLLPNEVVLSFDPEVKELSNAGVLLATYPVSPPGNVTGTNTANYGSGLGMLLRLNTTTVVAGRRLKGRVFIVPVASFDAAGNVLATAVTTLQGAAGTLVTARQADGAKWAVFSRTHATTADVSVATSTTRPQTLRTRNK